MSSVHSIAPAGSNNEQVESEARAWLVRLGTGNAQPADHRAFEHWRAADPAHAVAYARAARLWNGLSAMQELAALEPLERLTLRERLSALLESRHTGWWALPVAAAAMLLAFFVIRPQLISGPTRYTTGIAEVREVRLPDGSTVTLGARSALETDFSARNRQVKLAEGEAFFAVARDAGRPFTVDAGEAVVRVVGTRFNVNRSAQNVRIDVLEGAVRVSAAQTGVAEAAPMLTAGQRLVARAGEKLAPTMRTERAQPDAWREGRLVYFDACLADIVNDANRYYAGHIALASPAIGELRLTASFRTGEIDGLIATLDTALPIAVERRGTEIILRAEAPPRS